MIRVLLTALVLAAVLYALFWLLSRRNGGPTQVALPPGPVGPDDDEDFLRELEWRRRQQQARDEGPAEDGEKS